MNDGASPRPVLSPTLLCGPHRLALDRPLVMGVLNVTPDSFSDGGRFADPARALDRAREMLAEGADLIDIGGESTRPGAAPTPEREEIERVIPLLEWLRPECDARGVPLSVDTRKPAVMRAAIAAGGGMINDVSALRAPGAVEAVAGSAVAVCLMHMQGEPATMQQSVAYTDVVTEVKNFLKERAQACETAGIARERIAVDPGFGFGKTVDHNLILLSRLAEIVALGFPVAVGLSRKSTIGAITGRDVNDRIAGSIAAALAAVARGAAIIRAHDVRETVDALKVWRAAVTGSR
ncbi:MAG TPA: dihydropteroate synthase [Casimicrobiaceae bacterium]|nr:dihydropteroate synthase [Casimicrobiaceae bacterium]